MIFKATAAKGHRSSNQSHARVGAARDDARTPATGTTRMMARRSLLLGAAGAAIGGPAVVDAQPQPPARAAAPPPFVMRGIPGPGHEVMKVLAGKWRAAVTLYIALGSPTEPVTSRDCVTTREWIGEGRYLYDTTTGTIAGFPFWRVGTLGYSNMDRRFEWVTQDGINSNMMIYLAARNSGPSLPISMTGTFTDQGVLGEKYAGMQVGQRTEIVINGPDEHVFDLYFTPPGEPERLADRKVYTRL